MYDAIIEVIGRVPQNSKEELLVMATACAFLFLTCYCLLKLIKWVTRF